MKNLLFIGGVHGSGKNFLLNKITPSVPLKYLSASQILKWEEISETPKAKLVTSIDHTQDRLVRNLNLIVNPNEHYLLDGHFTLLNSLGNIEMIPEETFIKIDPRVFIVKIASPQIILARLQARDGISWSLDKISKMQDEEMAYSKELSEKLNIPLYIIKDNQEKILTEIINKEFE